MLARGKQFLLLIRHPPCYSFIQSTPVKNSTLIEERKKSTHHNDHVSFTNSYCLHIHRIVIDIQSHSVIVSVSISGEAP
jgi:hypothetical protein